MRLAPLFITILLMAGCVTTDEGMKQPTKQALKELIKGGQSADYQWMIETQASPYFDYIQSVRSKFCRKKVEAKQYRCKVRYVTESGHTRSTDIDVVLTEQGWRESYSKSGK